MHCRKVTSHHNAIKDGRITLTPKLTNQDSPLSLAIGASLFPMGSKFLLVAYGCHMITIFNSMWQLLIINVYSFVINYFILQWHTELHITALTLQ